MLKGGLANKAIRQLPEYVTIRYPVTGHEWEVPRELLRHNAEHPDVEDWCESNVCPSERGEFYAAWGRRHD